MRRRQIESIIGLAALLFLAGPIPARAQDEEPVVTFKLSDVSRLESWSFFEPRAGGGDPNYTLFGNRAALAVAMRSRHLDLSGAFQYAQLLGLPRTAVGPGPLGPGATYFEASRAVRAYQLYLRAMSVRLKASSALSLEAGRMDFTSGEGPSASSEIERLTRDRLAGRLIGGAEWTPFERAFDGVRLDIRRAPWRSTSAVLWPTQGAFEESVNPTMTALRLVTGSFAFSWPESSQGPVGLAARHSRSGDLQLFAMHYRDRRGVRARPDNSGLLASSANVSVGTVGASHVGVFSAGQYRVDTTIWAAGQVGDWFGVDHRAFSLLASAGLRLPVKWQPHVAAGWLHASGDDDPRDLEHRTFFPMLPTTAPSLLAGTVAQMNLRQAFAEVRLVTSPRLTLSASVSRLSLANPADRWYTGTGATAIRGTYFGFSTRSSAAATGLGTLVTGAADTRVSERWRIKLEAGVIRGGDVIRRQFASQRLLVFVVESRVALGGG